MDHEEKTHETGSIYVNENCWRALHHLLHGSGPEWRKRIIDAIADAHRPGDNEFFTQCMSPQTLAEWRACVPVGNSFAELSDNELAELAEHLGSYLFGCQRDLALWEKKQP